MSIRLIRFLVVMLAALSLAVAISHVLQLPARMAWDQALWIGATAQGGFYALSGPLGVLLQVFTIIALIVLVVSGNVALLINMAKNGGIPWDHCFSGETFRHYKHDPESYLGVVKTMYLQPHQVMLCAAHNGG